MIITFGSKQQSWSPAKLHCFNQFQIDAHFGSEVQLNNKFELTFYRFGQSVNRNKILLNMLPTNYMDFHMPFANNTLTFCINQYNNNKNVCSLWQYSQAPII